MTGRLRILFAGVGGQGVLSAGRWLGDAAHAGGLTAVVGQVHGMAQRGGSVQASVVIGGARSPAIPDRLADVLVALEPMEGTRALNKLSETTAVLVNTRPVLPVSLQVSGRPYPELQSLLDPIAAAAGSLISLDATALAEQAGSARCLNVVMLGMLAGCDLLPIAGPQLLAAISGLATFGEINRRAFELGVGAVAGKIPGPGGGYP